MSKVKEMLDMDKSKSKEAGKRNSYSRKTHIEVVRYARSKIQHGSTIQAVAKELDINPTMLGKWMSKISNKVQPKTNQLSLSYKPGIKEKRKEKTFMVKVNDTTFISSNKEELSINVNSAINNLK